MKFARSAIQGGTVLETVLQETDPVCIALQRRPCSLQFSAVRDKPCWRRAFCKHYRSSRYRAMVRESKGVGLEGDELPRS